PRGRHHGQAIGDAALEEAFDLVGHALMVAAASAGRGSAASRGSSAAGGRVSDCGGPSRLGTRQRGGLWGKSKAAVRSLAAASRGPSGWSFQRVSMNFKIDVVS